MLLRFSLKVLIALVALLGALGLASEEQINAPDVDLIQKTDTEVSTNTEVSIKVNTKVVSAKAPLEILEFVLANKVEGREPNEIVETFSQKNGTGMAYAFARLNAEKHLQVTFVWFREGKERNRFTANVQAAKKWRTYSSTKLRPGNWKVQLEVEGEVLAERAFVVQ